MLYFLIDSLTFKTYTQKSVKIHRILMPAKLSKIYKFLTHRIEDSNASFCGRENYVFSGTENALHFL